MNDTPPFSDEIKHQHHQNIDSRALWHQFSTQYFVWFYTQHN